MVATWCRAFNGHATFADEFLQSSGALALVCSIYVGAAIDIMPSRGRRSTESE